jgi:hypothetical protein
MNAPTTAIRELARRLIALEAPRVERPNASESGALRACDKLRLPLVKLVGVAGYRSLISRALAISKAEAPSLEVVHVQVDGALEGFDGMDQNNAEAGAVVLVYLLNLLVEFIGEALTLGLVRDVWPEALQRADSRAEK